MHSRGAILQIQKSRARENTEFALDEKGNQQIVSYAKSGVNIFIAYVVQLKIKIKKFPATPFPFSTILT
jgi:hypothetical protein